jgi:protein-S-isoprenylcysteine O-methyltransferase Ste14
MNVTLPSQHDLARKVYVRVAMASPAIWALIFIPAGTLAYWEGWLYLVILLVPMFFVFRYLLKNDPALLERRLQMREADRAQRRIIGVSLLYVLLLFAIPGLDRRFGWSDVSPLVVLAADGVVLLGYALFALVLRENSYASRTIQVEAGQHVITTGPYRFVRHPMYLAATLMYLATPLALGSIWGLIPAALIIPILVARIINEERVLDQELAGYLDYKRVTTYRLVPGIW